MRSKKRGIGPVAVFARPLPFLWPAPLRLPGTRPPASAIRTDVVPARTSIAGSAANHGFARDVDASFQGMNPASRHGDFFYCTLRPLVSTRGECRHVRLP